MNTPSSGFRGDPVPIPIKDAARPVRRILVVEDDHDIRQFCAEALVRSGYRVDCAEDGAAGWQALQANGYNLLVTDNDMPKVSGVELVKKLRAARMDLAVVLASGAIPAEEIARNPSLQLAATLQKPFIIGELVDTVEKVLRTIDATRARSIISFPATAADRRQPTRASPSGINVRIKAISHHLCRSHSHAKAREATQRSENRTPGHIVLTAIAASR